MKLSHMPYRTSVVGAYLRGNGHVAVRIKRKTAMGIVKNLDRMFEFKDNLCVLEFSEDVFIFYKLGGFKFVEKNYLLRENVMKVLSF